MLKKEKGATNWTFLPNQPYNGTNPYLVEIALGPGNNVYILNGVTGSSNVLWKFDGTTWTDLTTNTMFYSPVAAAVDQAGNVYVADKSSPGEPNANQIRKLSSGGSSWSVVANWNIGGFTHITALTTDINNNLYATEALTLSGVAVGRLVRKPDGTTSWAPYPELDNTLFFLKAPNDMAMDRFGNLYVTTTKRRTYMFLLKTRRNGPRSEEMVILPSTISSVLRLTIMGMSMSAIPRWPLARQTGVFCATNLGLPR